VSGTGVGAYDGGDGEGLGALALPAPVVLGAATVLEPAHQRLVPADDLQAVDAEVVVVLLARAGAFRDDQRPGDERRRLAGPAGLDRQAAEIDVGALQHDLLARGDADGLRLHRHDGLHQRQQLQRLAPAAGRLRLLQEGERLADGAQLVRLAIHAPGDALDGAEEVDQHGHVVAPSIMHDVLEQHGRAALGEQPGLDLRHLQHRRHRRLDPHQALLALEPVDEVAQGGVGHGIRISGGAVQALVCPGITPQGRRSEAVGNKVFTTESTEVTEEEERNEDNRR
jgi:hypothetical protein